MALELWLTFGIASCALLVAPGPTVLIVVSYALGRGRTSAWATVPAVALGDLAAMTVSLAGAGAILAASATLFTVVKLVGAGYLVWLGIQLWRAKPSLEGLAQGTKDASARQMFWNCFLITALNPKGIVFFIAFVPQFIDRDGPLLLQFAIMEATFVGLGVANVIAWALLAGQLRARFQRPSALRFVNRLGASFLIGAGLLTALARRGA
ncbi:MAG: LysE family translocator [Proteobacteria bacterium]|nr:LysE family translocator [Pseudomonadota bacterium]